MPSCTYVSFEHFPKYVNSLYRFKCEFLTILLVGLLSSCASLHTYDCESNNWHALGVTDGTDGEPASRVDEYQASCKRNGFQVDVDLYEKGWQEGVAQFCTRESGYIYGMAGQTYKGSCTSEDEENFLLGYETGSSLNKSWHRLQAAMRQHYKHSQNATFANTAIAGLNSESGSGMQANERYNRRVAALREARTDLMVADVSKMNTKAAIKQLASQCLEAKMQAENQGFNVSLSCE